MAGLVSGKVVCLDSMVTAEEVQSEDGYKELLEDVTNECSKYGKLHVTVRGWGVGGDFPFYTSFFFPSLKLPPFPSPFCT